MGLRKRVQPEHSLYARSPTTLAAYMHHGHNGVMHWINKGDSRFSTPLLSPTQIWRVWIFGHGLFHTSPLTRAVWPLWLNPGTGKEIIHTAKAHEFHAWFSPAVTHHARRVSGAEKEYSLSPKPKFRMVERDHPVDKWPLCARICTRPENYFPGFKFCADSETINRDPQCLYTCKTIAYAR